MIMEKEWVYRDYRIRDGLRPGSKHFQYFYVVSEGEERKYNYCVWITDEALASFDRSEDFNSIVASKREDWNKWVEEKIDAGDFGSKVLRIDRKGEKEIELSEMKTHLTME
jgi:hypothetical protein